MRIAIEMRTHSPWVSRLLEECGHEAVVANARKLRSIYANKRKTDEVDAENLARLIPKLLCPSKHRGEECQAHLAFVRSWAGVGREPHAASAPCCKKTDPVSGEEVVERSWVQRSSESIAQALPPKRVSAKRGPAWLTMRPAL